MKKVKRKRFPAVIFIFLLFAYSIAVSAGLAVYFIHSGRIITSGIEQYTKKYSVTLAEAVSESAASAYSTKKTGPLVDLLENRIREDVIDEAFFVLNNGKIIAHSKKTQDKSLGGNLSNDEFSYNLEMILYPSMQKTKEVLFTNYHLIDKSNPFDVYDARIKKALKQYLYNGIDSTGWITSKAVFYKGKPVGTVSFIISKARIFDAIISRFEEIKKYWKYGMAGSAAFSLLIALMITFSAGRRCKNKYETFRTDAEDISDSLTPIDDDDDDNLFFEERRGRRSHEENFITIDISGEDADFRKPEMIDIEPEIIDAIPIRKNSAE
jgi:hypothetical protein